MSIRSLRQKRGGGVGRKEAMELAEGIRERTGNKNVTGLW